MADKLPENIRKTIKIKGSIWTGAEGLVINNAIKNHPELGDFVI